MAFENRRYVIIPAEELANINFSEVMETSAETCRLSIDNTKTFVKYEGNQPPSVAAITNKSQEYTQEQILEILATEQWTSTTAQP